MVNSGRFVVSSLCMLMLALLFPVHASAATVGGTDYFLDGVYNCSATVNGATEKTIFALNEKPSGELILIFAATSEQVDKFVGFGAGNLGGTAGELFSGTSTGGKAFSFNVTYQDEVEPGLYLNIHLSGNYVLMDGSSAAMECDLEW